MPLFLRKKPFQMYLLGYDIGSSSVKAALVEAESGKLLASAQYPESEMPIAAPRPGWAEQDPEQWWEALIQATRKLLAKQTPPKGAIAGIGIAYQMHGLVCLDASGKVLRPSIIWCDSRAVATGEKAFNALGESFCLEHYLNSPGNFTASKLAWVRENEPEIFKRIHRCMLPGDYIAYRMSGEMVSTVTGLSEGVFWDFKNNKAATRLMEYYGIPEKILPEIRPVFGVQGALHEAAAAILGLSAGIPICYRAGDQPNNAFTLGALQAGEVAATGGTSGVVYAVSDGPVYDTQQRVNSFAHVNYTPEQPKTGILLCINGAGSMYRWVRENLGTEVAAGQSPYVQMEKMAAAVAVGSEGLTILPFGNGAERMLGNREPGALIAGLDLNRHGKPQLYRAALEGIAFAFVYGMEALRGMGVPLRKLRVGNDNLFQSAIFSRTIATLCDLEIEIYASSGAEGAARGAGMGAGVYASPEEAVGKLSDPLGLYSPDKAILSLLNEAYDRWLGRLGSV